MKTPIRHLHVVPTMDPASGGPAEIVRQLCQSAVKHGDLPEVAALDAPGSAWTDELGCPVWCLGPARLKFRYASALVPWLTANASRFDFVVVHGLWQYHSFGCHLALAGGNIPYFVFPHGMLDPWFKRRYPLKHLKKWLYWPWSDYRVLRDAAGVWYTCEEERIQARKSFWLYRAREEVVTIGTPPPSGDFEQQREIFFRKFPHLKDRRLILFLGRVHPKKGCDILIDAFSAIQGRPADLHLVMAGPDQLGLIPQLKRQAGSRGLDEGTLTWTGPLSGDLKWGAFLACEAFVLPSHQENFGIAVVEALARRRPVLISNKVNIWREIVADEAGLAADDSVTSTAAMLQQWINLSKVERSHYQERAFRCFATRFEIDAAYRGMIDRVLVSLNRTTERRT